MKKYSFLIALMLIMGALVSSVSAQSFKLYTKSGEAQQFDCSDVDSLVFEAPESNGPTFKLEYSNLTSTTVTLKVTPDDPNVNYYYDCITTEQLASSNNSIASVVDGYISYLQQTYPTLSLENILSALLSKGYASDDVSGLPANTDFVFYAIPVGDDGKCYGEPTTTKFTTLPGGDPADCTFDFELEDITSEGLTMTAVPSDASVRYWMGITSVADYPGDKALALNVKSTIEQYATEKGMTVAQVVKGVTFTAKSTSAESGLEANTQYYVYAYAMGEDGGCLGKVYKKLFTTRSSDISNADISIRYRYFNGDDLKDLDAEKYGKYAGRVLAQVVVTPNEAASNWVVALAKGDLSDATTYPDESTKNAILQGGKLNKEVNNFVADWTTCTLFYYGADASGVDGELHRLVVDFDKNNARPASEYSENAEAPRKLMRAPIARKSLNTVEKRMIKNATSKIHRELLY